MYPPIFMIHTCDLVKRIRDGSDSFGNPKYLETTVTGIRCRFTGTTASLAGSGYVTTAKCTLAGRTDLKEDDIVKTNTAGLAKKYWINFVRQAYEPVTDTLSHTILELRETPERVRV